MPDNRALPTTPRILLTQPLTGPAGPWLARRADVMVVSHQVSAFAEALHEADGLVVRTDCPVDDALLSLAPHLRVIGRAGVGLDHIDLPACARRTIAVVHTPDANTQAVTEYVLALLLDALRPRTQISGVLTDAAWNAVRSAHTAEREIASLSIGILGMGRIGRRLAGVLRAISAQVLYHDLLEIPGEQRFGAVPVGITELFERSDVISVHVDGRPSNTRFVSADLLGRMQDGALLINTSRGRVLDHDALAAALHASPARRAVLDVHDPEPVPSGHPLLHHPRCRLLPHLASRTRTATHAMEWVVRDVVAVLEGHAPKNPAPAHLSE